MKSKKFNGKLALRKQTITNIDNGVLSKVKGGACTQDWSGCDSINRACCSVGLEWSCIYPPVEETVYCSFPTCKTYITYCE